MPVTEWRIQVLADLASLKSALSGNAPIKHLKTTTHTDNKYLELYSPPFPICRLPCPRLICLRLTSVNHGY